MAWEIAAAAGASALSGFASAQAQKRANEQNIKLAREQMAWQSQEAQKQMDFQERMSNTSHQRESQDLKAAGLNPILSLGSGASTPGGAMGSAQMPEVKAANELQGIENAISSAVETRRLKKELDATDSQVKLNKASEETQKTQQLLNQSSANKIKSDEVKTRLENEAIKASLPALKEKSKLEAERSRIDQSMLKYDSTIDRVNKTLNGVSTAIDIVNPLKIKLPSKGGSNDWFKNTKRNYKD